MRNPFRQLNRSTKVFLSKPHNVIEVSWFHFKSPLQHLIFLLVPAARKGTNFNRSLQGWVVILDF